MWIARKLSKPFPQLGLDRLKSTYMTRSKEELDRSEADPFIYHGKMKAHWGMEMLGAMDHITSHPKVRSLNPT